MALLRAELANDDAPPPAAKALANGAAGPIGPCPTCGSYAWWRRNLLDGPDAPGPWRCAACHRVPKAVGWLDVAAAALHPDAALALLREAGRVRLRQAVTTGEGR